MSQDKNRRKQEKQRRKKKKEAAREQSLNRKREARATNAYSTNAFAWPIKYRRLAFVKKPNFVEPYRLEGTELSLTWYNTLDDRRTETNGEVVSSLEILSSFPIPMHNGDFSKIIQCRGRVHQLVKRGTDYGDWLNRQPDGESSDVDEYRATDVEFLVSFTFPQTSHAFARLAAAKKHDELAVFRDAWNVGDVCVADHTKKTSSALALDRLFELLHMLRIVVPRRAHSPSASIEEIEAQISRFEAEEYAAGIELAPRSEESRKWFDDWFVADKERCALITAARIRHAAFDLEIRQLQAIPEDTSTADGRARKSRLHRLISDRGTAFATAERLSTEKEAIDDKVDQELLRLA